MSGHDSSDHDRATCFLCARADDAKIPEGFMECPDCQGMGEISMMQPTPNLDEVTYDCQRCGSSGMILIDHTSGVMRCRYQVKGGHVHCHVFGPYSGKAGDLVFRVQEWDHFKATNPGWYFIDWDALDAQPIAWQ